MIRKTLLSSVILVAITGSAFAADLPSRQAPAVYAPVPVFSGTGVYVGGQIGYALGRDSSAVILGPFRVPYGSSPHGIIGGAHVGYNFSTQSLPMFGNLLGAGGVIGLEGDVDGTDYRSTRTIGAYSNQLKSSVQGSVRGRLGFAIDRALLYVAGGAAFADFRNSYVSALGFTPSLSHSKIGWTVGGGVEYAVTDNWSVRGEYRYSDFGSFTDFPGLTTNRLPVSHTEVQHRVQIGFSYKFDTLTTPVVARY